MMEPMIAATFPKMMVPRRPSLKEKNPTTTDVTKAAKL